VFALHPNGVTVTDTIRGPITGLYPYLGYELGLWMSADPPVKTVDPSAQHKWSPKYSLSAVLYMLYIFNFLKF